MDDYHTSLIKSVTNEFSKEFHCPNSGEFLWLFGSGWLFRVVVFLGNFRYPTFAGASTTS